MPTLRPLNSCSALHQEQPGERSEERATRSKAELRMQPLLFPRGFLYFYFSFNFTVSATSIASQFQ